MFVSWVHPVAVLRAALCRTCSLLMLVEDVRGVCVDTRCSVCNACVLGFVIGVGSEFAVSMNAAVTGVVGPGEGECMLVRGVCVHVVSVVRPTTQWVVWKSCSENGKSGPQCWGPEG